MDIQDHVALRHMSCWRAAAGFGVWAAFVLVLATLVA